MLQLHSTTVNHVFLQCLLNREATHVCISEVVYVGIHAESERLHWIHQWGLVKATINSSRWSNVQVLREIELTSKYVYLTRRKSIVHMLSRDSEITEHVTFIFWQVTGPYTNQFNSPIHNIECLLFSIMKVKSSCEGIRPFASFEQCMLH